MEATGKTIEEAEQHFEAATATERLEWVRLLAIGTAQSFAVLDDRFVRSRWPLGTRVCLIEFAWMW